MPYAQISYFKHFNAMRFVAAFLVLVHHAEQIRLKEGLANFKACSVANLGHGAVLFFFVLSGFLITFLLLKESAKTGTVHIGKFYQRRVVRIWPLYFLLVVLGLWVVPMVIHWVGYPYTMPYTTGESLPWFLFFMPFVVNILYGHSLLEPLWSIGVEELFYLGWAPAFKWLRRHLVALLLGVVAIKYALLVAMHFKWVEFGPMATQVIGLLAFEAMAIGGLGAWWVWRTPRKIAGRWWALRKVQWLVLGGLVVVSTNGLFTVPIVSQLVLLLTFVYLLITLSVGERSVFGTRENRWINQLGEVSYGVYMFHMLVIFGVVLVCKPLLVALPPVGSGLLFYGLITVGTVGVAWCSKRCFENFFLRLKKY